MTENTTNIGKKIVITGPESSGKSFQTQVLAKLYKTIWLPEYAREYLNDLDRPYEQKDLLQIAYGQLERERRVGMRGILHFVDTSFEVLKVWSEWKYGNCEDEILKLFLDQKPDFYLLMSPDLPWEEDDQRETPNDRQQLFEVYYSLLSKSNIPFQVIEGEGETRNQNASLAVESFLNLQK